MRSGLAVLQLSGFVKAATFNMLIASTAYENDDARWLSQAMLKAPLTRVSTSPYQGPWSWLLHMSLSLSLSLYRSLRVYIHVYASIYVYVYVYVYVFVYVYVYVYVYLYVCMCIYKYIHTETTEHIAYRCALSSVVHATLRPTPNVRECDQFLDLSMLPTLRSYLLLIWQPQISRVQDDEFLLMPASAQIHMLGQFTDKTSWNLLASALLAHSYLLNQTFISPALVADGAKSRILSQPQT